MESEQSKTYNSPTYGNKRQEKKEARVQALNLALMYHRQGGQGRTSIQLVEIAEEFKEFILKDSFGRL